MSTDLSSQIHSELTGLVATKQRQVLAFVRTLKKTPKGLPGLSYLDVFAQKAVSARRLRKLVPISAN